MVRSSAELVGVAVLAAVLWRAEVEWRGWAGLAWVRYAHWAAPVGAVLFVAWLVRSPAAPRDRRWVLAVGATLWAWVALWVVEQALRLTFVSGPAAFVMLLTPPWVADAYLVAAALVPVASLIVGRICGGRPTLWLGVPSMVLWCGGLTWAGWIAGDEVLAVKSGWAVPFAVLALGLPWVRVSG